MAVGQTEPLDTKEGKKRSYGHWVLWALPPQLLAATMRELGQPQPDWLWYGMGAQLAVTAGMELWEVKRNVQTKGKAAIDFGVKAASTVFSWATIGWWW